jgi:hypothetical protein
LIPVNAQVGKFLKNVKNSVKQDIIGTPDTKKTRPEPPCACDPAELVVDLGKYQLDYSELTITVSDDGSVLLKDMHGDDYYIAKNGVSEGPFKPGNPKLEQFQIFAVSDNASDTKGLSKVFKGYVSKSGDKYMITFNGKNYGPYALISQFSVSLSKEQFAAIVTENIAVTPDLGKKMEEAVKNAKTDQEKMELSMQFAQQMSQSMAKYGPQTMTPRLVTNVPDADVGTRIEQGARLYNNLKYNEVVLVSQDKITDLHDKTIMDYTRSNCEPEGMFISSDNSRFACYSMGTLTFNDNKKLTELFNLHLMKSDGKIFLAYMYYSPKRNALMQCKIPF